MIGGTDVEFWVRDSREAVERVLFTVRRYWPHFVIENADDPAPFVPRQGPELPKPTGQEFFVYRDVAAAMSWEERGATEENKNFMLHVIAGNREKKELSLRSMTVVCGELKGEIAQLIEEIRSGIDYLNDLWESPAGKEAA